jgi:hypothetical protein
MEKKGLRKLQLTRETLRNLSTDELSRVVGGTGTAGTDDGEGCALTVLPCNMDPLPTAVGCGFPSDDGSCNSGNYFNCHTIGPTDCR